MSEPTVRGTVHVIEETKTYGQNGFRKRLMVLEQDKGKFVNYVPVEFTQDACDSINGLSIGDDVEVTYRLNGRKWQKDANSEVKFFLNAEGMSFKVHSSTSSQVPNSGGVDQANDAFADAADDLDDVPF